MSKKIMFDENSYYHLYNRGTEKRKIFLEPRDYERFVALLYLGNTKTPVHFSNMGDVTKDELFAFPRKETLVDIVAYCLMPNHFHLLVRTRHSQGISTIMQKILTAYTMFFNTKYDRTGTLFEGRYKAKHANTDEYLGYLVSYVHLNPIKLIEPKWKEVGIKNRGAAELFLNKYQYSSYTDYLGKTRPESALLDRTALPAYEFFNTTQDFKMTTKKWL